MDSKVKGRLLIKKRGLDIVKICSQKLYKSCTSDHYHNLFETDTIDDKNSKRIPFK